MRTTGVRCAPVPVPRPKEPTAPLPKDPAVPPQPLPRTRFLQRAASEEPPDTPPDAPPPPPPEGPTQGTLLVISQGLATPSKGRTPPPKPPRSPSAKNSSPGTDVSPVPRRPGLMEVLSRPNPSPPPSPTRLRPVPAAPPARSALQGGGGGLGAVPTRPAPRPRLPLLSIPQSPAAVPPRPPRGAAPPRLPLRPSPTEVAASRARMGAPEPRPAGLRPVLVPESPVCSVEDFEDGCKDVFRNTRAAKDLAARGKHVQAANHYQVALTALDRVLRAQVLTLTPHEMTRQRLFLLQQDVFNLRKEALNGFTDAQTAVRAPRGLSPTRPTPGAPPSYDDVIKEDRRRRRHDDPPSSSRQSSTTPPAGSTPHQRPPQRDQPLRPPPQQPTQPPSAHARPHSTIVLPTQGLEGVVLEPSTTAPPMHPPSAASSARNLRAPRKPSRATSTRPKSSYHPPSQPQPPLSLPPPLLPITSPPILCPPSPAATSLPPLPDEVLESQMKALQVCESAKGAKLPVGEGDGKDQAKFVKEDPFVSLDPLSSAKLEAKREGGGGGGGKDQAKKNILTSVSSSIDDPFLSLDPFPSVEATPEASNDVFPEGSPVPYVPSTSSQRTHSPAFSDDFSPSATEKSRSHSPTDTQNQALSTSPTATGMQSSDSQAFSSDFMPSDAGKNSPRSPTDTWNQATGPQRNHSPAFSDDFSPPTPEKGSPPRHLGDSILEALDFAVTPAQGHRRVSPQSSKGRSYSEENLLDTSHNTLEAILNTNRGMCASRASIIEEFDPLVASHSHADDRNEEEEEEEEERKTHDQLERDTGDAAPPKPMPRRTVQGGILAAKEEEVEEEEEGAYNSSPPGYYSEGGAAAQAEVTSMQGDYAYNLTRLPPGTQYAFDTGRGRMSYSSSEDSSSVLSWPPDLPSSASSIPASPPSFYPCLDEEEEEEEEEGRDVGRSAFYHHPLSQGGSSGSGSRRRDLLRIREGVKIYFIHTDGVITSPWKKPVLSVYRDPAKAQLLGDGMILSVGNNLWACELCKKFTMVLRTQTGAYVFSEVAGKPECKAVCIRVPSSVRRAQQEFLSKILLQHTRLEEERPKGFTKAISKGASSAATRMNKLVENNSTSPSQPFVRRNSMRALKGVSKRLNTIAEKTGATMKELPSEYEPLQEAADTLSFARNAKMIQYI